MMAVQSLNSFWLRELIAVPYLEGLERVKRACSGIDFHSVQHAHLSLKDRIVSLIAGLVLLVPLANTIIWLAWRTFGNPEQLSNSYEEPLPTESPLLLPTEPLSLAIEANQNEEGPDQVEILVYKEGEMGEAYWNIKHFQGEIRGKKTSQNESAEVVLTPDWNLKSYKNTILKFDDTHVEGTLCQGRLKLKGKNKGSPFEKDLLLEKNLPWIQQPTLGFRKFVLSSQKEFRFYCLNPLTHNLMESVAKKVGMEQGNLKVKAYPVGFFLKHLGSMELWFDPTTGHAVKMEMRFLLPFAPKNPVTLEQSDLWRRPVHRECPAH